ATKSRPSGAKARPAGCRSPVAIGMDWKPAGNSWAIPARTAARNARARNDRVRRCMTGRLGATRLLDCGPILAALHEPEGDSRVRAWTAGAGRVAAPGATRAR